MSNDTGKRLSRIGWGICASILLHGVIAAAFLVRLPLPSVEPPKEETIQVELVPPPEQKKPEEKPEDKPKEKPPELNLTLKDKPEEQKPPEPKREEPKKEEPPKPEEAKKEEPPPPPPPPPEPPKPEQAEKKQPPPPPPPKPEEPKKKEPPPPKQEPKAEPPPPDAKQGKPQPLDVLRPVVEFGDKDSGPRVSKDGDASADAGQPPDAPTPEQKPDAPPQQAPPLVTPLPPDAEKPAGTAVPDQIAVPEVDMAGGGQPVNGAPKPASSDGLKTELVAPPKPRPKPEAPSNADKPLDLPQAKTLFSTSQTGDSVARTAMGNIPRDVRARQLCSTELKEQLRHGSPSYSPEIVPAPRLPSGTVMDVRRAAFRADAQWYDISFRCELDENITRVVSFSFDVGPPVPQSQWRKRGFPEF